MRFWTSLAAASAVCTLAFSSTFVRADAEADNADSDVITLTQDTFDDIKSAKLALVEFYAPWCGHCKALAPEYEVAATALKEIDVKLAKVDCTVETEVCKEYDIRGYPMLKVFREGNAVEYNGPRKSDGIISYMKKQSLPALSKLTADTINEFKDSDKVVIVGFLDKAESVAYKALESVANQLRDDFVFGATVDAAVAKTFGVAAPGLILFKKFDEGKAILDKATKFTADAITEFIKKQSIPTMAEISPETYKSYIDGGDPLAYLFVSSDEDRASVGPGVKAVAKEFKGKVNFVFIDAVKFGAHGKNLNLKDNYPAFAIQDTVAGTKFPFDQTKDITEESIREFVQSYVDGKLEPNIKSEPIPESNDGPVKVIVAKNFDEIVKDKKKDVLVEFYAPWCGHCKKLAPIYEELGSLYPESSNIVIAKMDATENDLPVNAGFTIQGFPTLKLFKAKTNEIVEYNGDRGLESFKEFLKENSESGFEPEASADKSAQEEDVGHDEL